MVHDRVVRQVRQARSSADKRLLTNRWREEAVEAEVDPNNDGNAFSFYYLSAWTSICPRANEWDCENLRKGCPGMVTEANPGSYSYLATDTSPAGEDRP